MWRAGGDRQRCAVTGADDHSRREGYPARHAHQATPTKERTRVFTPEAIAAFKRMEAAETDREWWDAHAVLWHEVGAKVWEWPCFEDPRDECPYPPGCEAARRWHEMRARWPERFELYYQLVEAARA